MKRFKDRLGREWTVELNVSAVKRVRDLASFDLLAVLDGRRVAELLVDPVRLTDVLYAICRPHAEAAGVNDVSFGEGFSGEVLDAAADALLAELLDFFRKALRGPMEQVIRLTNEVLAMQAARDVERLKAIDPARLMQLAEPPPSTPGSSPGGAPESSDATPAA